MKTTIIGIDPGSGGAIAIWKNGRLEHTVDMPKKVEQLKVYFDYVKENNDDVLVFIEKVQMFMSDSDEENKGKQFRIKILLANYEQLKALIVFYGFAYCEVSPITWQSTLGFGHRGVDRTTRKNLYKKFAEQNFPNKTVTLKTGDALCILKFALLTIEFNYEWIDKNIANKKKNILF